MVPNDLPLAQHFECIGLASLLVTDKPDLAEGTDAQDPELDQVFELDAAIQLGTDGREGLAQSGYVSDDALDSALRKDTAGSLFFSRDRLVANNRIFALNRSLAKVITGAQVVNHSVVVGNDNLTRTNDVEILLRWLAFFRQNLTVVEGHLRDEICQPGHLIRLEVRVRKDWHAHKNAFLHGMVNEALQRTQRLLERLSRQAQSRAWGLCRYIGHTGFTGEEGSFSKPIAR
mmetsp:Transcript_17198/g.49314  ORF Transcript_17198/g.49314 Transcript_17198/m.49314 type:complete len:231 (+) Transcript_17198:904-1596(+)